MKTRIITAFFIVVILAVAVFRLPKIVMALLVAAMAAVAAYELLHRTGLVKQRRLVAYSMVMAFLVELWCFYDMPYVWTMIGALAFTTALFGEMLICHNTFPFCEIAYCYISGMILPLLLGSLVRIHNHPLGEYEIAIPFVLAFASDTGAYFAGSFFGKHKLAPVISPKKTVEGMVGGTVFTVLCMAVYGLIMEFGFHRVVHYPAALVYGLIGSVSAVFGDLCFSAVKRQTGIKDYGNLFPGHGGILDRFDSMMIVAPLVELLLMILPVLE